MWTYFLRRSGWIESAGTDEEGIRSRFAVLNLRVITKDDVVKQTEEVFVAARLQTERHAS